MKLKKLTTLAVFTSLALIIFIIEAALPPLAPIPGIKLGLANVVTLILLLHFTARDAFLVLLMRILLAGFFAGQAVSVMYSLAGGLLCFGIMFLSNKLLRGHYIFLTSILGGCFHNLGQLLTARLITGVPGVWAYLPLLLISGILTGLFTGLCAHFCRRYLLPHLK